MAAAVALVAVALALPGPAPDQPLPTGAQAYAGALALATESVRGTIDAWTKTGRTPLDVELWSLYQQRLYLALGLAPALSLADSIEGPEGATTEAPADVAPDAVAIMDQLEIKKTLDDLFIAMTGRSLNE